MPIKVGRIIDLHSEPFYIDMERRGMELCSLLPNELGEAAENGTIDAGPLPLDECFRLEDKFNINFRANIDALKDSKINLIRLVGSV